MSDAKRKLFGLFKSLSVKTKESSTAQNHDGERKHRRDRPARHPDPPPAAEKREETKATRLKEEHVALKEGDEKSKEKLAIHTSKPLPEPLTDWPPTKIKNSAKLSRQAATDLITPGAPIFIGTKRSIPHAADEYYNLYASCTGNGNAGVDCGDVYTRAFEVDSMAIIHSKSASHPWETLEQPSMAFYPGTRAGEITLNHWVSMSSNTGPALELRDSGVQAREVEITTVLNRLIYLEGGFEEDYEDLMYKNLYGILLKDPEKFTNPHKKIENQITDLILVLTRPKWIDFSLPQNQIVAKFFSTASHADLRTYKLFFHQLLLSLELYHRLHSKQFTDDERLSLLTQLPPRISWNLAVARKWKECMKIENFEMEEETDKLRFHLRNKRSQVKALRKFARVMKWPNLVKVDEVLKERDIHATRLEDRSSDAMSYFTGMILPGVTMPWLIMNSLIDCDVDAGVNALQALTHMYPNTGFQYRSTTYWAATCIVGKVLAPTCRSIGGWVGPARPAPDLGRIQIARIRQRTPRTVLSPDDVLTMCERSDPLGPPTDSYPVTEYDLLMPEIDPHNLVDTIRIEKLALRRAIPTAGSPPRNKEEDKGKPVLYDAAVQFAIDGESWPLRLSYDVSFISACPCARGPHPLFFDYVHRSIPITELLAIRHWGSSKSNLSKSNLSGSLASPSPAAAREEEEADDMEKVLVIEAFGITDNEVLARAWCSHWALSAVVADMEKTCLGCAVREAYAACLNVVILIEALEEVDDDK